ncbi:putative oxido YjmC [Cyphellophora attinorum]|uniref:Putative oxido YjmC n=1 Tax=Cyphellophora attinorum TaxID=1664694 RepID=A0A0N1NYI7_9EURO|nr:putative oxido YjmC [Phialophora attinorum]KPI39896.1 putative oxido YjmC [Phialophora attinorum]
MATTTTSSNTAQSDLQPTHTQQTEPKHYVTATNARLLASNILKANNVPSQSADLIAQRLIAADLRGIDTHGMARLPSYLARIRSGALSATATPTFHPITPCVGQVDGHNAFGHLCAHLGMSKAIEMAQTYGIGMVSVKRSNHFGMSAWIVQQALDAGMMSLVFTNSSPALPAWGGREKILGVSPIACGAPGGTKGRDFVLDMAPSVAARGKIHKAKRRGEKIPWDWALDGEGKRTDDPTKALEEGSVMLPMGGPKGSGLSVMMDVFSGVLSGSNYAGGVIGPYDEKNVDKEADVGHFLVAIKPDLFMSSEEFRSRMDVLYQNVVGSKKMDGVDRIYFPGEIEQLEQEKREREGIPLVEAEVEALNAEARRLELPRWCWRQVEAVLPFQGSYALAQTALRTASCGQRCPPTNTG